MNKTWHVASGNYFLEDVTNKQPLLENGIYTLEMDPNTRILYLSKKFEKFKFDFKIYGIERKFIDHALKTYKNTKGNLGILLNGIKGTGLA